MDSRKSENYHEFSEFFGHQHLIGDAADNRMSWKITPNVIELFQIRGVLSHHHLDDIEVVGTGKAEDAEVGLGHGRVHGRISVKQIIATFSDGDTVFKN